MNGVESTGLVKRMNFYKKDSRWLSINSETIKYHSEKFESSWGEHNSQNKLHGRGIHFFMSNMYCKGSFFIAYWENGRIAPGTNYIDISLLTRGITG